MTQIAQVDASCICSMSIFSQNNRIFKKNVGMIIRITQIADVEVRCIFLIKMFSSHWHYPVRGEELSQ